jgi:hypothetical protein
MVSKLKGIHETSRLGTYFQQLFSAHYTPGSGLRG